MTDIWKIYKATGNCGRSYIGVTRREVSQRWRQHVNRALRGGSPSALHRAIVKYGEAWFKVQVICECYSEMEVRVCERAMIADHNTYIGSGCGFNLTVGGEGTAGRIVSAETRAMVSAAYAGKKQSPERASKSRESLRANSKNAYTPNAIAARTASLVKTLSDVERGEKIRHRWWAQRQYEKALASRVGRQRRYRLWVCSEGHSAKRAAQIIKVNSDKDVQHRKWANREYHKALAARIGYERSYGHRSDRGSHKPQSAESIAKMTRTKKCNTMWRLAMNARGETARAMSRAGFK